MARHKSRGIMRLHRVKNYDKARDKMRHAKKPGKRPSRGGGYYESRENRADANPKLGL